MKVSYIIPVYNTAVDKLIRCFESIKNTAIGDYEVVIINDGSSKNDTIKLCEAFCEKDDKYFKFYSYDNGGVSSARNRGIFVATGDYIYFVDSDDQLISNNINIDEYSDYDIVLTDIVLVDCQGEEIHSFNKAGEMDSYHYLKNILIDNYLWGPYAKFIKRSFLLNNEIDFEKGIINGEDAIFNLQMLLNNPNTIYISKSTYKYWKDDVTSYDRMRNRFAEMVNSYIAMQESFYECINAIDCHWIKKEYLLRLSANRFTINMLECFMIGDIKDSNKSVCKATAERLELMNLGLSKLQKSMLCKISRRSVCFTKVYINILKFMQKLLKMGKQI